MYRFKHLRNRILAFVLALFGVLLTTLFIAVNGANLRNARAHVDEALLLTVGALQRSLQDQEQALLQNARLLSGDFAFKSAFASGERGTILSALNNHRARVGADVMLLLSMEEIVVADTLHPAETGIPFAYPGLLEAAYDSEYGEASTIVFIDGIPHQLVVVPLFTPDPSAWIVIGYRIDDDFAAALRERTRTQVSLLHASGDGRWRIFTSTLPKPLQQALEQALHGREPALDRSTDMELGGESFVALSTRPDNNTQLIAVLQRSLEQALAPYLALRPLLAGIVGIGLLASWLGAWLIARSVTRPVEVLAAAASRIEAGDYEQRLALPQRDELGALAASFNSMTRGLADRRRVRALLGKVVSPAIAEELLNRNIELGGEERQVSVLFADVREFTTLCESLPPQQVLSLLNRYLSRMSDLIETEQGVVDKYIGDAIMALFGAPLGLPDHCAAAVRTALAMCAASDELNAEFRAEGSPELQIGIGINSGDVVAGNMGSANRHNYTVIGDTVNLAARVEGLGRYYGARCVVTDAVRTACDDMLFRELDRVRVKGKSQPVTIFEPLPASYRQSGARQAELLDYQHALAAYLARDWQRAEQLFGQLQQQSPGKLHALYLERSRRYRVQPPAPDWDGVYSYAHK